MGLEPKTPMHRQSITPACHFHFSSDRRAFVGLHQRGIKFSPYAVTFFISLAWHRFSIPFIYTNLPSTLL